jgi:tetratricopeptide (TPR) repeat protein
LAARKHLTRHDMKQDELVSGLALFTHWIESNSRQVMIGAGVVAGTAVLILAGYFWYEAREEKASVMLGVVQTVAGTPLLGEAGATTRSLATAEERALAVVAAADKMLDSYGSGTAANWARYTRAGALLELGRIEEASVDANASAGNAGSGTLLKAFATVVSARTEEARGNLQRAVELYEEAASFVDGQFPTELALLDQARCQGELGDTQAAMNTYQKIMDIYPDSPVASNASRKLQDLRDAGSGT